MIVSRLTRLIREGVTNAAGELGLEKVPDESEIELERPPRKELGDFSTNIAFLLSSLGVKSLAPRQIAAVIVKHLPDADFVAEADVAGAGFINFRVRHEWLYDVLRRVAEEGDAYGRGEHTGARVQVEFVSANPTGPLHIGHARNAVIGDALSSLLDVAGDEVSREYYYNDAGRQMELFAHSVEARLLELDGYPTTIPEGGYHGDYITDVAREIKKEVSFDPPLAGQDPETRWKHVLPLAVPIMLHQIESTLDRFGIHFDSYVSERTLHDRGLTTEAIERMTRAGQVYEKDGAVWFRSTGFGDDKDRVLIRSNKEPTYFAADCAYLIDKFGRGFDHFVYVWGQDHEGDVRRVKGAAEALGYDSGRVEMVIYRFVTFKEGGRRVEMSKRTGEIITLDELLDEVGPDAARYTLLTRSSDSPIDFDIEEVKRQSLDNPVYYVQYAHARIASILRNAEAQGVRPRPVGEVSLELLTHESELELLRKINELPREVQSAAGLRAPYRLTHYVEDLAAQFHRFYTECRVLNDDAALTQARLWLCVVSKQTIANVLRILGVSAPESMERIDGDES